MVSKSKIKFTEAEKKLLVKIEKLCLKTIEKNFSGGAFLAGPKVHYDWWSSDNLLTSLAIYRLGFQNKVKSVFDFFLNYQDRRGLIPLRVETSSHTLRALKIIKKHREIKPIYISSQPFFPKSPVANNALLVIIGGMIARQEKPKWLKERFGRIEKVAGFLEKNTKKGLLVSGRIADWDDNITLKAGFTLYANVLYTQSVLEMSQFYLSLRKPIKAKKLKNQAEETKSLIQKQFWNGQYFSDWINPRGKHFSHFDTLGNILAILFNTASPKQARQIEKFVIKNKVDQPPAKQKFPSLPFPHNLVNKLIGFIYQTHYSWPWLGAFDIAAKAKSGFLKEAKMEILALAKVFDQWGPIEIIKPEIKPIKGLFYESEKNFTLATGTFLYALDEVRKMTK